MNVGNALQLIVGTAGARASGYAADQKQQRLFDAEETDRRFRRNMERTQMQLTHPGYDFGGGGAVDPTPGSSSAPSPALAAIVGRADAGGPAGGLGALAAGGGSTGDGLHDQALALITGSSAALGRAGTGASPSASPPGAPAAASGTTPAPTVAGPTVIPGGGHLRGAPARRLAAIAGAGPHGRGASTGGPLGVDVTPAAPSGGASAMSPALATILGRTAPSGAPDGDSAGDAAPTFAEFVATHALRRPDVALPNADGSMSSAHYDPASDPQIAGAYQTDRQNRATHAALTARFPGMVGVYAPNVDYGKTFGELLTSTDRGASLAEEVRSHKANERLGGGRLEAIWQRIRDDETDDGTGGRTGAGAAAALALRQQREARLVAERRTQVVQQQLHETNRRLQNLSPRDPTYAAIQQRADSLRGVLDQYSAVEQQGGAAAPALPMAPASARAAVPNGVPSGADDDYAAARALAAAGGPGNAVAKARYDALVTRIAAAHGATP